jgi:Spy/CpxP family protein refolding chaperone
MGQNMRRLSAVAAALGLVVIASAAAWSQQPQGRGRTGGRGPGAAELLANEDVRRELKITDGQAAKIEAFSAEYRKKIREDMAKVRQLSEAERAEKSREIAAGKHHTDMIKGLEAILTAEQIGRLEQITLQHAGAAAFTLARVQQSLKITDDQKSKIGGIARRLAEESRAIQGDREEAARKTAELQKVARERILALLSEDQRKTWKQMTGEPFEAKFGATSEGAGRRSR